jgi:hypothetical protein
MGQYQDRQSNHAPAVALDSADYLTNKKIIREYEQIQVEHLHQTSWLGRLARRPGVRRFTRNLLRLVTVLIALSVAIALLYYLEQDARMATGE